MDRALAVAEMATRRAIIAAGKLHENLMPNGSRCG